MSHDHRESGWRKGLFVAAMLLPFWFLIWGPSPAKAGGDAFSPRQREILDAIRMVESGDRPSPPDGDGGRAIGPYQIHKIYWTDAVTFRPELGGSYQDCRQREYAERVIAAYMERWASDAWALGDAETIARIHNGGPTGDAKTATDRYWSLVEALLEP